MTCRLTRRNRGTKHRNESLEKVNATKVRNVESMKVFCFHGLRTFMYLKRATNGKYNNAPFLLL